MGQLGMKRGDDELMLQTAPSLAEELDVFEDCATPGLAGTVYFRGYDPDELLPKVPGGHLLKAPFVQWYGMRELYLRDPDDNGVELYWDRPSEEWPYDDKGELAMFTARLDVQDLLNAADG